MSLHTWCWLFYCCAWISNVFWTLVGTTALMVGIATQLSTAMIAVVPLGTALIWLLWSTDLHKRSFWKLQ